MTDKMFCPECGHALTVLKDRTICTQCELNGIHVVTQLAEDTCEKHNVFCCEECFDMSESED